MFKKIDELSNTVDFYTIKLGENTHTEFELFVDKEFPDHQNEIELLYNVIDVISVRGAKSHYFKFEGPAHALPKVDKATILANEKDLGIRLYCIRITEYLLVLLNGDIKTKQNPLECPRVARHFKNAIAIAKKLDRMREDDDIDFQETDCLSNIEIEI